MISFKSLFHSLKNLQKLLFIFLLEANNNTQERLLIVFAIWSFYRFHIYWAYLVEVINLWMCWLLI